MKKLKIVSVNHVGKEKTYCLRMKSNQHNFILENGVVSGNSHAVAYGITSYLCMWFKKHYPIEWISAVLSGATKDDFKIMYQHWENYIKRPNINESKDTFFISPDGKSVVMPFSSINGVGESAVKYLVAAQPFTSFADFFQKIDKRKVNKGVVLNLILSGCFDIWKPEEISNSKWRKGLVHEFIDLRHAAKKPTKLERETDATLLRDVDSMNRGRILIKEIGLLNFTSFDYFEFFKDKMTTECARVYGKPAMRPHEIANLPDRAEVVVGGSIESIDFVPIKSGKNMGKERAIIKLTNQGGSCMVTVFPNSLEADDKAGGAMRKLEALTPIIVKGSVNIWNGNRSVILRECMILI